MLLLCCCAAMCSHLGVGTICLEQVKQSHDVKYAKKPCNAGPKPVMLPPHPTQVAWLVGLEACDPSVRTALGETALHLSAVRGDERMCQTLLDGGCPPEAVTREGKTALHLAAGMGKRWIKGDT